MMNPSRMMIHAESESHVGRPKKILRPWRWAAQQCKAVDGNGNEKKLQHHGGKHLEYYTAVDHPDEPLLSGEAELSSSLALPDHGGKKRNNSNMQLHGARAGQKQNVPKGFLAVYVGPEQRRFIIPMSYLSMPEFRLLMDSVAEEFGFEQQGVLRIPCEEQHFEETLHSCFRMSKITRKNL